MESIKLIIRTANNKYDDFYLELSPLLTVYDLKQKIASNHPTKPVRKLFFSLLFQMSVRINRYRKISD
jgi:hypothetical protein